MSIDRPDNALTWSEGQRSKALRAWRSAIFSTFGEKPRALRVAWLLSGLFGKDGYAFATDATLARETNLAINKLQATLKELHESGAIIRCHVANPEIGSQKGDVTWVRHQRRIFPCRRFMPEHTPHFGGANTPQHLGGHNRKNRGSISTVAIQARRAAEIRDQKSLERERAAGALAEGGRSPIPMRRADQL